MLLESVWAPLATVVSTLLGMIAIGASFYNWRRSTLRQEHVLAWSNEVIDCVQSIVLVLSVEELVNSDIDSDEIMRGSIFKTSILVERGRLFFKNSVTDDWGSHKKPAYRGYRPLILDPIVICHQVAVAWPKASPDDRARMRLVAESAAKEFVSLAQKEVGRGRTASAATAKGGQGVDLARLMRSIDSV